jgi:16S rRNA processing protein RimM
VSEPSHVVVGHVSRPHGTQGELFIWPLTDRPETTFVSGETLWVADLEGALPDSAFAPVEISAVRPYRKGYLVSVDSVRTRAEAEPYHGRYLLRPLDAVEPLDEGELFYHQLLGLRVLLADGTEVGRVVEVYPIRPFDLLEVDRGDGTTALIPFQAGVVQDWDLEAGTLTITPPEGLLDVQAP